MHTQSGWDLYFRSSMSSMLDIMTNPLPLHERRTAILAEMATIHVTLRGKLTEQRRPSATGGQHVYYRLQSWRDGRNHTRYIPPDQVAEVRIAIANHHRLQALTQQLVETTEAIGQASPGAESKKKRAKPPMPPGRNSTA